MESDQIKNLRCWVTGRPFFKILLEIAEEVGTDIFLVGGLVRDWLLGRETQDVDLTLSKEALKAARIFAARTGGTFVLLREEGETARVVTNDQTFDFCKFRGPDLEADLKGRDFTINAIALPLAQAFTQGEWVPYDPLKGIEDLHKRVLRLTSPDCFQQDPLRMLRAFRLSAQLGLMIHPETRQAIKRWAFTLTRSAPERIHYEWQLLLALDNSFVSIKEMEEVGLLTILFPELGRLKGIQQDRYHHLDVFQHSLLTFQCLEKLIQRLIPLPKDLDGEMVSTLKPDRKRAWLKWAALFHDLGKAATGNEKEGFKTFYGHPEASQTLFGFVAERYRLSNREKEFIEKMIGWHMRPLFLVQEDRMGHLGRRALNRLVREGADELSSHFLLALADSLAAQGNEKPEDLEDRLIDLWRKAIFIRDEWLRPLSNTPPLISGRDLIELGLTPGPIFKTLLSEVEEEQWDGEVKSREEAIEWVKRRLEI